MRHGLAALTSQLKPGLPRLDAKFKREKGTKLKIRVLYIWA